jgi:hypothetical protein
MWCVVVLLHYGVLCDDGCSLKLCASQRDVIIDYRDVAFNETLGKGTFGEVFKGTCRTQVRLAKG